MSNTSNGKICPICNGLGFVTKNVPVGHPDFGRAVPCECKQRQVAKRTLDDLHAASNLGMLQHMTFDNFNANFPGFSERVQRNLANSFDTAYKFAQNPEGWLIFIGGYGCGKTHLAVAIANYQLKMGRPVLFIVVPDLLDYLRVTFAPHANVSFSHRFDEVREAPLLILDDLGTESNTPWAQEKLYQIFNYRYSARLPTVVTTNRKLEQLDPRIRSRMEHIDVTACVTIIAPDYRSASTVYRMDLSSLPLYSDKLFSTFKLRNGALNAEDRANLRQAFTVAQAYAELPSKWLIFIGPHGVGKTHLAAAIANYRVQHGYSRVLFISVADLLDHLRATYSPTSAVNYDQRFEEIKTVPLLILDGLGVQNTTAWAREKLYQLLDYRYVTKLPTVITMNKTLEEMEDEDPQLGSRLLDFSLCTSFALLIPRYQSEKQARDDYDLPRKK